MSLDNVLRLSVLSFISCSVRKESMPTLKFKFNTTIIKNDDATVKKRKPFK